jgi:hypothetical protein
VQTRLNKSFGSIAYAANSARANYAGFVGAVQGRFSKRGVVTVSYTRSNGKDDWQSYPGSYPYDRYYGPSNWNAPNRFSLGWSYLLPDVENGHGLLGRLASGYSLSGSTILQSGTPFSVYTSAPFHAQLIDVSLPASSSNLQFAPDSGDFNADGDNFDFPNVTSYSQKNDRESYKSGVFQHCSGSNLNNCGNFTFPSLGTTGNEKTNQFQNPGYAQTDLSLKKTTSLYERLALELRMDAINAFNRPNLNGVDTNAADGNNFGTSSSTQTARTVTVSARVVF